MLNFRQKMKRFKASNRSETMIKEMKSFETLNKSSNNLRKETFNLSHKVLLIYLIRATKSNLESITCPNSMSGFRSVMNFSKMPILDTQSRPQSTLTWSKEKITKRSKACKQMRLRWFFRPNLRRYSLDLSMFNSILRQHLSICRSQGILRASKICWSPSLFVSKTSEPTQKTSSSKAITKKKPWMTSKRE